MMEKEISFEVAMARLEQIVSLLEEGKLPLDDSLSAFEEGIALVKLCNGKLDAAEQRVRILVEGDSGEMSAQDFSSGVV